MSESKKLLLILVSLVCAIFAITGLISWVSSSNEIVYRPAAPPRFEVRRWVNEAQLPSPPPPLATERFSRIAGESKKRQITQPSDIVSPELPKKLYKARQLIQACGDVQKAWKWEDVKKVIEAIGKTLPIFYMKKETYWDNGGNFGMAYLEGEDRILIPDRVADLTDEDVASVLVHEATHAVMFHESLKASGYKREELRHIHEECWDVDYEHYYATEALAHYNQARWLTQCVPAFVADAGLHRTLDYLLSAAEGNYSAQDRFSQFLVEYDRDLSYHKPKENELCGPLVMIRGDKAGQYFFSADLYLDLIGPLIGAREKFSQHP